MGGKREKRRERILQVGATLRIAPGTTVKLPGDFGSGQTDDVQNKRAGRKLLRTAVAEISDLQERLAAEDRRSLLVVLQAIDAGGKDSTIRNVFSGVNPAGVRVQSFKEPTDEELAHDYLWRYRQQLPAPGQIAVFNRSHYEEVLVVRVHPRLLEARGLSAEGDLSAVWRERYREINAWEHQLSESGTTVVKLLLNISREEQRLRFLRRLDLPEKNWKFAASDVRERAYWDDYQRAFSEMVSHTSTEWAPWYVIPADHKWFGRLATASIVLDALQRIDPRIPRVGAREREELAAARAELIAEAPPGAPADPIAKRSGAHPPDGPSAGS
ncbi:MAG TPA: PPK2 family polyphosphate kinase [Solirubrobacteraceae bacterium]|nr:PPK2 family polyphosphate kinase [Solirubrobacteraceae bacterium]